MCNPAAAVAAAKVIAVVVGTGVAVASARQQSKDKKAAAEYNARVSENESQETRNLANEAENAQRLKTSRLLSKQKAQLGAANIDLSSGSALQLQEDTISLGEADALRIRRTGDSQFSALGRQSELETAKGSLAESQGRFNIAGSLLSGASQIAGSGVADKWFTEDSAGNPLSSAAA